MMMLLLMMLALSASIVIIATCRGNVVCCLCPLLLPLFLCLAVEVEVLEDKKDRLAHCL